MRNGAAAVAQGRDANAPATIAIGEGCAVSVGQILVGKYRVLRLLGEGGMGVVLAVHHLALGQTFALKVLAPGKAINDEHRVRFAREARAAARLTGPHVVRVVDSGELTEAPFDATPFLVMEFAAGRDLAEVLDDALTLPVETAVRYTLQACEALAEAHVRGLVHRDLKPSNLLLCEAQDGTPLVKLLDFGISKLAEEFEPSLTTSQAVMGTPRYMAPEQMRSAKDADARADLWALGVILYEMLAGVTPFDGGTLVELVIAVQQQAPMPLSEVAVGVPEGLVAIVHRLLDKDPSARFPNVGALAAALAPFAPEDELPRISRIQRMLARAGTPSEQKLPTAAPSSGMLPDSTDPESGSRAPSTPRNAPALSSRTPARSATALGVPALGPRAALGDATGDALTANVVHEELRRGALGTASSGRQDSAQTPDAPGNVSSDSLAEDDVVLPVPRSRLPLVVVALLALSGVAYGGYRMQVAPVSPPASTVASDTPAGSTPAETTALIPAKTSSLLLAATGAPAASATASTSASTSVHAPGNPAAFSSKPVPSAARSATPSVPVEPPNADPDGLSGQH